MSEQEKTTKNRPGLAAVMASILAKRGGTRLERKPGSLASLTEDFNLRSGRATDGQMKTSANLDALRSAVERAKQNRA